MKTLFPERITRNSLFLWFINRLAEEFGNRAILKGGVALQLYDCPRSTNDLDYVFVPYKSKKEVIPILKKILKDIPGQAETLNITMNSKAIQIQIIIQDVSCQLEGNVAMECESKPVSTKPIADTENQMSRIIRVMSPNLSLSHKLAAWNERRLIRDLYDIYFLFSRMKAVPDMNMLYKRLKRIQSRLPRLTKIKTMTIEKFISELKEELKRINPVILKNELGSLLDDSELAGLEIKLNVSITGVIEYLEKYK